MKLLACSIPLLAVLTASAHAQVVYNSTTHTLQCPNGGHAYCGNYMPLSTNIIIRCNGHRAVPANCDDNLAGISPVGVKTSALCFESDSLAGNAACYYNGIVYPDSGNLFRLPSAWTQFLHNTTNSSVATSSTSTMSLNLPTGYGPTIPSASGTGIPIAPGSGGYNGSSVTSTGAAAAPTGTVPPPKATATFIGGAVQLDIGMGLGTALALLVALCFFL